MLLLVILQIISTEPLKENECWISRGVGESPQNVLPRLDLPEVSNAPGGVLIPIETSQYLSTKLRCLWRWPEVCQSVINTEKELCDTRIKDLSEQIEVLKIGKPVPSNNWFLWLGAGAVSGAFVGLIAGILVAK
jgi:hypothetical protein